MPAPKKPTPQEITAGNTAQKTSNDLWDKAETTYATAKAAADAGNPAERVIELSKKAQAAYTAATQYAHNNQKMLNQATTKKRVVKVDPGVIKNFLQSIATKHKVKLKENDPKGANAVTPAKASATPPQGSMAFKKHSPPSTPPKSPTAQGTSSFSGKDTLTVPEVVTTTNASLPLSEQTNGNIGGTEKKSEDEPITPPPGSGVAETQGDGTLGGPTSQNPSDESTPVGTGEPIAPPPPVDPVPVVTTPTGTPLARFLAYIATPFVFLANLIANAFRALFSKNSNPSTATPASSAANPSPSTKAVDTAETTGDANSVVANASITSSASSEKVEGETQQTALGDPAAGAVDSEAGANNTSPIVAAGGDMSSGTPGSTQEQTSSNIDALLQKKAAKGGVEPSITATAPVASTDSSVPPIYSHPTSASTDPKRTPRTRASSEGPKTPPPSMNI
ncbi:MAG: hypothetical protein Q8R79_01905 [Legionellaceae bacterium]|nr:hypothetical protein [Legionellaceae bacterium]